MRFCGLAALLVPALLVFPPLATAQIPFAIEVVDSSGRAGIGASLALDRQGRPHVAYLEALGHQIRYTAKTGSGWTNQPGPGSGDTRAGVTLVLDAVDSPGISHVGRYFRRVGAGWVWEEMGGFSPWFSTVAQDAVGRLQGVTIWSLGSGVYEGYVSYTERILGSWSDMILTRGAYFFYPTDPHASIAIDRHGDPHISVTATAGDSVRYWHRANGVWSQVVFATGAWSSIALDAEDVPRISYYDTVTRDLVVALRRGAWEIVRLDQTGDVGQYTSQEIRDGVSYIAYYAKSPGDLRYAVFNPAAGQGTVIQTVDSTGDVGGWTSLALDGQGLPRIAYFDFGNGDLKYAAADVIVPTKTTTLGGVKSLYKP